MLAFRVAARYLAAVAKRLRVFDFDDTLVSSEGLISVEHADGEKITMDSATFAHFSPVDGDKLDFGAFNDVIRPRKIKKNFGKMREDVKAGDRVVILTARAPGAATAVQAFLEHEGLHGIEIAALGSSDPYDKARWIDKAIEEKGYDDVEFYDDSKANARAVEEHGMKHQIKFISAAVPHPSEEDYEGPPASRTFKSTNPTKAVVEIKPKGGDESKPGSSHGPSDWWKHQTPAFKKDYCQKHPASAYCGGEKTAATDPNEKRKAEIGKRVERLGNHKVKRYVGRLLTKMDQMGPHAGIWLENLEAHWGTFAKPEGLLGGFEAEDFATLHKALFGVS
jgi:hypothetical protein